MKLLSYCINNLVISVLCYFILRVAVGGSRADVANSRSPDRLTAMVIPQWFPGLSKLLLLGPGLAPLRGHCLKATHSLNCSTNISMKQTRRKGKLLLNISWMKWNLWSTATLEEVDAVN